MLNMDQFKAEFEAMAKGDPIHLELEPHEAWCLMAELQLALRHPENNGPSAEVAKAVATIIQHTLAVTPALAEVAEMGWNSQHDVTV